MKLCLIHWNAAEARDRAATLRAAGYAVVGQPFTAASLRKLKANPPAAFVIDLTRLPSQGRDVAIQLRHAKATRHVPIVFADGDPVKLANIKRHLPDAVYTPWSRVRSALKRAIANPPENPEVPSSVFAAYAGVPLAKKLGIKANAVVALVNAPQGFENALGTLPRGTKLRRRVRGQVDMIVWFAITRSDVTRRIDRLGAAAGKDGLWIAWPKKASGVTSDLSQTVVRELAAAHGLVDYKVAAIDHRWSGLRFTRKKPPSVS